MEENLLRFAKNQRYMVLDVESEDLRLFGNRPWQVTWGIFAQTGLIKMNDYFPWWGDLNISKDAARITRFNYDDYKRKAENPKEILEKFNKDLYNEEHIIVWANGHNFDAFLINTWQRMCGQETNWDWIERAIDIQVLAKAQHLGIKEVPSDPKKRAAFMFSLANWRKKGVKTSVRHLATTMGLNYDENQAHDAAFDVSITAQILFKQIWGINI
jgi:DNA polymerase III epsilon subunit-like protein